MTVPGSAPASTHGVSLVVMAAGMGSRFGGLKQLEPVGPSGELVMDYSVFDALRAGVTRVVFVVRRELLADFRAAVGSRYEGRVEVRYAFQELDLLPPGYPVPEGRKKPWGTGHAVLAAADEVEGPFIAINADDFYGAASFELLAKHLSAGASLSLQALQASQSSQTAATAAGPAERYALVAWRLANTLSENGTVSRGVCETDADGALVGVREYTTIRRTDSGARHEGKDGAAGAARDFTGEEPVSMNFWGFTPSFFTPLRSLFEEFLKERGTEVASEFFLPAAVDTLIRAGRARVQVLRTPSPWLGVTYREDLPVVREAVRRLVAAGEYRERLWG